MMHIRKIVGLMACDPRGVIGKMGTLPWSYPEELEHFRHTTYQRLMIMGRKTYESIPPTILKDRFNIVFSRKYKEPFFLNETIVFVSSLKDFLALTDLPFQKESYMIGGAEMTKLFLEANLVNKFLLTQIHKFYEGDTIFPLDLLEGWDQEMIRKEKDFTIYKYTRFPSPSGREKRKRV